MSYQPLSECISQYFSQSRQNCSTPPVFNLLNGLQEKYQSLPPKTLKECLEFSYNLSITPISKIESCFSKIGSRILCKLRIFSGCQGMIAAGVKNAWSQTHMAQTLQNPQRYRGFVLTATGLQKLHERVKQIEIQTRLRQNPRTIAERIQLSDPDGIHPITIRKILGGESGVDKRSLQLVFQVLQLPLEEGDCAHAGLSQLPSEKPLEVLIKAPVERSAEMSRDQDWYKAADSTGFYGRINECAQLNQAIAIEHCRFVQILGIAGIGKTAIADQLVNSAQSKFEFISWKSLHHAPAIQTVLTSILQSLMQQAYSSSKLPTHVTDLTGLLIEQLQQRRCLIVFDHFDSILEGKQFAGYCRPGYEAYGELLQVIAEVPHQSCLVITSREKLRTPGIAGDRHTQTIQLRGLATADCQPMINHCHVLAGSIEEWRSLTNHYHGNPLILKTVATYIQKYFNSCISDYLQYLNFGRSLLSDLRDLLDQQFDRLSPLERELAHCLSLHQEPVSIAQLRQTLPSSTDQHYLLEGLDSLSRRSLLHQQESHFVLDPIMRMYLGECLIEQQEHSLFKPKLEIVSNNHTVA